MTYLRDFHEITPEECELVGGKGLSLGLMAAAGLPVPPGFCITTDAYRQASGSMQTMLLDAVLRAYDQLGGGMVAVRSSATAEDGAAASFAGQQETFLGIEGEQPLKEAIERCWSSLHSDRAKAYRRKQGIEDDALAMAVVVQRLIHADVAGVLFTRDPHDPHGAHMLVECSWGLGEAVVSGKVTPDSFQVLRANGQVTQRRLGSKSIRIEAQGRQEVSASDQARYCLTDAQLAELTKLGQAVEDFYGSPRDVEWAWAEGQFWLLQARPITTASAADRERVRQAEIDALRKIADPNGTVWSRYNLIEVLPEPTPMTWRVVQNLLSGNGGSGLMYRDLGFKPSPLIDDRTVYDLIGGRPYCNLSREPYMQAKRPQADYPFEVFKQSPLLALAPEPDSKSMYKGFGRKLRLLGFVWRQMRFASRISKLGKTFAEHFHKAIAPTFVAEAEKAGAEDVAAFDAAALMKRFDFWVKRTLVDFARDSLKPTLLAQFSMQVLEQQLKKPLGRARAREAVAELSAGAHPDVETDFAQGIRDLAGGKLGKRDFLKRFGHRGNQEMELAQPRWAEDHASLDRMLKASSPSLQSPLHHSKPIQERWNDTAAEAKLNPMVAKWLFVHVERLQTYLGLRETAKHYLMQGYALIRQALVELDRRVKLQGGIFYLIPPELHLLVQGVDLSKTIDERRRDRAIALSLEMPPVIFSDDLDAIGRPLPVQEGVSQLQGIPLSAGVAEGKALVLSEPADAPTEHGYILVCPSTDPAWVPLFVNAKGLVMESGGSLSHGAIVAREFGLPAVAGLPGVHLQLHSGQRLRVDGGRGTVTVIG